ncbi:fimbrial protein [Aeromonas sp. HMWF014]|uniref:fimbrial protein n=1 Tax=Aeromonas sp. HMWF014 TaxID=2056850 RepID=UPI0015E8277D|nr:fimbrial protein [Aeromonas sp. HMWF014]
MKKTTVAAAMLFALCANVAYADDIERPNEGSGEINFIGSIINAPCSIYSDSINQTIHLGQVSNATLDKYNESKMVDFNIKLEGCTFETAQSVDITFDGVPDATSTTKLALNGSAAGAAIQMFNKQSGEAIELNKATNFTGLYVGDNTLRFGAKLVKTAEDKAGITPGEFDTKAHFVMKYK